MRSKKAALVINPRAGENVAKITDVMAVLAAAGMKTDIALKEYGGRHSRRYRQRLGWRGRYPYRPREGRALPGEQ